MHWMIMTRWLESRNFCGHQSRLMFDIFEAVISGSCCRAASMSACAFGCLALQMGMPFVVTYPYNIILLVNDRDDVILRCDIHTTPLVRFGDSLPF